MEFCSQMNLFSPQYILPMSTSLKWDLYNALVKHCESQHRQHEVKVGRAC